MDIVMRKQNNQQFLPALKGGGILEGCVMNLNINDKYISTIINESDEIIITQNNTTAVDKLTVEQVTNMNDLALQEFLKKQELRKQNVVNVDEYDIMFEMKKHKLNNVSIEIEKDSEFLEIDTGD